MAPCLTLRVWSKVFVEMSIDSDGITLVPRICSEWSHYTGPLRWNWRWSSLDRPVSSSSTRCANKLSHDLQTKSDVYLMCTETLTDLYTPPPHITRADCIECCQVTVWTEAAKGDPQGMYSHKAQQWPWHLGELCQLCQHFSSFARAASCWGTCSVPKKQPGTLEISNTWQNYVVHIQTAKQRPGIKVISSCISGFHGNSSEKRSPVKI